MAEKCENCGSAIGKLETPFVYQDSIVCVTCYEKINSGRRQAASSPPPVKPKPAIPAVTPESVGTPTAYVDSNLTEGEFVTYRASVHWAIYLPGIILAPVLIGVLLLIVAYVVTKTTEMAVTNRRVIAKTGLISRRTLEMNLSKIENVGISQGVMGRILGYGVVTVSGTGGTRETFQTIAAPLKFRRAVQDQTHGLNQ